MSSHEISPLAFSCLIALLAVGCHRGPTHPEEGWNTNQAPDANTAPPDGGPDTDGGPYPVPPGETTCSDAQQPVLEEARPQDGRFQAAGIPWRVLQGPTLQRETEPIDATWQGVVRLGSAHSLDCPAPEANPGLECTVDEAIAMEYEREDGSTGTMQLALPLPYDAIDWPEPGTEITVETHRNQFLTIRETGAETPVIGIGSAEDESLGEQRFDRDYGEIRVRVLGHVGNDNAVCRSTEECGQVLRLERLEVEADETRSLDIADTTTAQVGNSSYRFWHAASYRANGRNLREMTECANTIPPRASYAFARIN
jgi:hypothetical protein